MFVSLNIGNEHSTSSTAVFDVGQVEMLLFVMSFPYFYHTLR